MSKPKQESVWVDGIHIFKTQFPETDNFGINIQQFQEWFDNNKKYAKDGWLNGRITNSMSNPKKRSAKIVIPSKEVSSSEHSPDRDDVSFLG